MMRLTLLVSLIGLLFGCSANDPAQSIDSNQPSAEEMPTSTSSGDTPETPPAGDRTEDNPMHPSMMGDSSGTNETPEPTEASEPPTEPETPSEPETPPAESSMDEEAAPQAIPFDVEYSDETDVRLMPEQPVGVLVQPRPRRRMNVDQLQNAMAQVSGGIGWTERQGRNEVNLFQTLAGTLGKPDFRERTDEELDPTVLFQKFLGDASRSVCSKMLQADLDHEQAVTNGDLSDWQPRLLVEVSSTDTLASSPEAYADNVRLMIQRFHGRTLDVGDPGLANWHWFVRSAVHVTQDPKQAWLGLCVALFSHPDFYTF